MGVMPRRPERWGSKRLGTTSAQGSLSCRLEGRRDGPCSDAARVRSKIGASFVSVAFCGVVLMFCVSR